MMSNTAKINIADDVRAGVFIVIAAFNEEQTIKAVVEEVRLQFCNVVVIDDGSSDSTSDQAAESGATVLRHVINRGQGAALQTGIDYSLKMGAQIIVTYDADGQHNPADISNMITPILENRAEITLGSRFIGDHSQVPRGRKILLKAAVFFTLITSGIKLSDAHNGFRAFSRLAAGKINIRLDRMAHASEIIDQIGRSGLSYLEVPVNIKYTKYSISKGQSSVGAVRVIVDYLMSKLLK